MTKYILGLSLFFSLNSFAAASDDNEINIEKIINTKLSGNKLNKISPLFPRVEK